MGQCYSFLVPHTFEANKLPGEGKEVLAAAEHLGLSERDVNKLYTRFMYMDVSHDHKISINEFITGLKARYDEVIPQLVFRLFDADCTGSLNFYEFLVAFYHFLSLDKDDLVLFTFQLFDISEHGSLSMEDVEFMSIVLYGNKSERNYKSLKDLDIDADGEVQPGEFLEMINHHQGLLFPVFDCQMHLREYTLGVTRWEELTLERIRRRLDILGHDSAKKKSLLQFSLDELNEIRGNKHASVDGDNSIMALKGIRNLPFAYQAKLSEAEKKLKAKQKALADAAALKVKHDHRLAEQRKHAGRVHDDDHISSKAVMDKRHHNRAPRTHVDDGNSDKGGAGLGRGVLGDRDEDMFSGSSSSHGNSSTPTDRGGSHTDTTHDDHKKKKSSHGGHGHDHHPKQWKGGHNKQGRFDNSKNRVVPDNH